MNAETVRFTVALPVPIHRRLKYYAADTRQPLKVIVAEAIARALNANAVEIVPVAAPRKTQSSALKPIRRASCQRAKEECLC